MTLPFPRRKAPMKKKYWLLKSEPTSFSINDFKAVRRDLWDGIRNYQARNLMRDEMQIGDEFFFYHSSCATPAIVGRGKVIKLVVPDPTQFDPTERYYDAKSELANPRWWCVEVGFVSKAKQPYSLATMRAEAKLSDLPLLRRGNRLSIQKVSAPHWTFICKQIC